MGTAAYAADDGVWIVQAFDNGDEGRIVAVCNSDEEARDAADALEDFFPDLRFAFFERGFRYGQNGAR